GDVRRSRRLVQIAQGLVEDPARSFPAASGSDAALEGTYRLLGNADITKQAILAPHLRRSTERVRTCAHVVVAHDTSAFVFDGERSGLGPIQGKHGPRGFLGHVSLAMSFPERMPLGVVAYSSLVRPEEPKRNRKNKARNNDPNNESRRWIAHVRD